MASFDRQFTTAALTTDGSVSTRMRASTVIFTTAQDDPHSRVVSARLYGADTLGLLAWVSEQLAHGRTVILHPGKANYADPSESESGQS